MQIICVCPPPQLNATIPQNPMDVYFESSAAKGWAVGEREGRDCLLNERLYSNQHSGKPIVMIINLDWGFQTLP